MKTLGKKYFSRAVTWADHGGRLVLWPRQPRPSQLTLDPWGELAFSMADGEHTIDEFIKEIASDYPDGPPDGLESELVKMLLAMEGDGLIKLTNDAVKLPEYLKESLLGLDPEVYRKQMLEDGFIVEEAANNGFHADTDKAPRR